MRRTHCLNHGRGVSRAGDATALRMGLRLYGPAAVRAARAAVRARGGDDARGIANGGLEGELALRVLQVGGALGPWRVVVGARGSDDLLGGDGGAL